ncbi:MAG: dihydroneopterin aldolase [Bacteroidaceae bacterium]|nr:dihydroneopterin aldolase [Bacteroidaceae bacterium]
MLISLKGIRLYAYHGVLPQEGMVGGWFTVDVTVETELPKGAITDELADTVNYADIYAIVKDQMAIRSKLIENAAYRIANTIKGQMPEIKRVTVRLTKHHPPIEGSSADASVEIKL